MIVLKILKNKKPTSKNEVGNYCYEKERLIKNQVGVVF